MLTKQFEATFCFRSIAICKCIGLIKPLSEKVAQDIYLSYSHIPDFGY